MEQHAFYNSFHLDRSNIPVVITDAIAVERQLTANSNSGRKIKDLMFLFEVY